MTALQQMLEISSFSTDAGLQSSPPLFDSLVNDTFFTLAHVFASRYLNSSTLCLKKNRTPVTFSNNSNNPTSISTNFGTKNRQLIGT